MSYEMKKIPSYLKGLVETRARSVGDVLRLEAVLSGLLADLERVGTEVASCDRLIQRFSSTLDRSGIQPIRPWRNRYGERGALRKELLKLVTEAAPHDITTTELTWVVIAQFGLDFPSRRERRIWIRNSLLGTLKFWVTEGCIERLHNSEFSKGLPGRWRLKGAQAGSLDGLAGLAGACELLVVDGSDVAEDSETGDASPLRSSRDARLTKNPRTAAIGSPRRERRHRKRVRGPLRPTPLRPQAGKG